MIFSFDDFEDQETYRFKKKYNLKHYEYTNIIKYCVNNYKKKVDLIDCVMEALNVYKIPSEYELEDSLLKDIKERIEEKKEKIIIKEEKEVKVSSHSNTPPISIPLQKNELFKSAKTIIENLCDIV